MPVRHLCTSSPCSVTMHVSSGHHRPRESHACFDRAETGAAGRASAVRSGKQRQQQQQLFVSDRRTPASDSWMWQLLLRGMVWWRSNGCGIDRCACLTAVALPTVVKMGAIWPESRPPFERRSDRPPKLGCLTFLLQWDGSSWGYNRACLKKRLFCCDIGYNAFYGF